MTGVSCVCLRVSVFGTATIVFLGLRGPRGPRTVKILYRMPREILYLPLPRKNFYKFVVYDCYVSENRFRSVDFSWTRAFFGNYCLGPVEIGIYDLRRLFTPNLYRVGDFRERRVASYVSRWKKSVRLDPKRSRKNCLRRAPDFQFYFRNHKSDDRTGKPASFANRFFHDALAVSVEKTALF